MKCTPQKTISSRIGRRRLAGEPERVADEVGQVLDLGHLVVVGQDHRAALGCERPHLRVSSSISSGLRSRTGTGSSMVGISLTAIDRRSVSADAHP